MTHWHRLKALVLDSVPSPITRCVYNLGLDEFIAWFTLEPRPAGFPKAAVTGGARSPQAQSCLDRGGRDGGAFVSTDQR
jgi:hypothetical protein